MLLGAARLPGARRSFERVDRALAAAGRPAEAARRAARRPLRPFRALGQQAGAVGGFGDPAADLADAGRRRGPGCGRPGRVARAGPLRRRGEQRCPGCAAARRRAEICAGPITACTPGLGGDAPLPAGQRGEPAGSVIGAVVGGGDDHERGVEAGADRAGDAVRCPRGPGRPWRAGSGSAARSSAPGPGAASRARRRRSRSRPGRAAAAPRRRAPSARAAAPGAGADPPAVQVGPEQGEDARGRRPSATSTLSTTTSATVAASEASSEPGTMKKATSIESSSVLPAKTVVRPAVRLVARAASTGVGAVRQLFAEARDHQQGVVDAQRQAHHRADGQREGVDAEPVREDRRAGRARRSRSRRRRRAGSRRRPASGRRAAGRSAGSAGRSARRARWPRSTRPGSPARGSRKPVWVARTGGWTVSSRIRFSSGPCR